MTLQELLWSVDADAVVREIVSAYPVEDRDLEGYRSVFFELRRLNRSPDSQLTIVVSREPPDDLNPQAYWDVSGDDASGTRWGIGFTPWSEWLAMRFRVENCDLTHEQVAAHILWEMTWHGFDEETVQEEADNVNAAVDELKEILGDLGENPTEEQLEAAGLHRVGRLNGHVSFDDDEDE